MYRMKDKTKRIIAIGISGVLALGMLFGAIASVFM